MRFAPIKWSPIEVDYLKKNKGQPVNQLTIALAKSRAAIKKKLAELESGISFAIKPKRGRSKIGKRKDCNNLFFRSGWEANIYRLLKLDKTIQLIEYEPTDFTFWQFGHRKGTISYTPDFRITYKNGKKIWIEIKGGWLKPTDKTKIRRFQKYYPEEAAMLVAITPGKTSKTAVFFNEQKVPILFYYPELNKKYRKTIKNWE